MWHYNNISREDLDKKKDFVENIMLDLGAKIFEIDLPYDLSVITYYWGEKETISQRKIFVFNGIYYRVDEIHFNDDDKPYIVLECGTFQELMNNTMEDADPFPYDLSDEEIRNEVKYSLGIEEYPKF